MRIRKIVLEGDRKPDARRAESHTRTGTDIDAGRIAASAWRVSGSRCDRNRAARNRGPRAARPVGHSRASRGALASLKKLRLSAQREIRRAAHRARVAIFKHGLGRVLEKI